MKITFLSVCLLAFLFTFSTQTFAVDFTVNLTTDQHDASFADGICDVNLATVEPECSLRASVEQANALPSNDRVLFSLPAGSVITLTTANGGEIFILNSGTLEIVGTGANSLTIDGGTGSNRIFNTSNASATIADVTLTDGGQRSTGGNTGIERNGGAILANGGSLTILRIYFTRNAAGGITIMDDSGRGGAVCFIGGTHSIQNSTFYDNSSHDGGGAIYVQSGTVVTIVNSTISGNSGNVQGGGLSNNGSLTLRNTTIAGNFSSKAPGLFNLGYGGGIANINGTLQMNNTIVAGNIVQNTTGNQPSPNEIYFNGGTITSTGNNFVGDSAGDSTTTGQPIAYQPTDIRDIPPMLAALADNGGTTPTRALLAGSSAIDAGNADAPPTDQRGAPRVGVPDIGAYERGGLTFSISGRVTSDGTNGLSGVTVTLSSSNSAMVTTNANGDYSFTGLIEGGNYTVTPTLANYTFSPLNAIFNNLSGNQTANFRPPCVYAIDPTSTSVPATATSGTVNVTASAGCSWTATSNSAFITVANGSGTGSGVVNYTVAQNSGAVRTGTITIAGLTFTVTQAALPTLSINNISRYEGNSGTTPFVFTVSISGVFSQTLTVNYVTVNGTATPPSDYQATSGSLLFAPGETSKTITILVNGDTNVEADETFTVNLTSATNAVITNGQGVGTIRNDDPNGARTAFDFDGDGRADISVFRPSNGFWYQLRGTNNSFFALQFGQAGDRPAPADYDSDGKTDIAVFRDVVPGAGNSAYFYITRSSDNSFVPVQFGATGDVPVSGDWDGDGRGDLAVYRDGSLTGGQSFFYYRPSSQPTVNFNTIPLGVTGDKPLVGDFDGDGRLDPAVFRPSTATWIILKSSVNQITQTAFGLPTDIPTPADFDGDGITNLAVFRPSNGFWYIARPTGNPSQNFDAVQFGTNGDRPVPADYDGDGKADVAVFRPSNGSWYILRSTEGLTGVQFGTSEDRPIPNAYIY